MPRWCVVQHAWQHGHRAAPQVWRGGLLVACPKQLQLHLSCMCCNGRWSCCTAEAVRDAWANSGLAREASSSVCLQVTGSLAMVGCLTNQGTLQRLQSKLPTRSRASLLQQAAHLRWHHLKARRHASAGLWTERSARRAWSSWPAAWVHCRLAGPWCLQSGPDETL